jgi:cation diffusion facilitator family transporter
MADGSIKVVLAALAGNVAIAVAKFAAFAASGSSAMLTEAIHSLVDTGDQILLLIGQKRSARKPDASHPLGYGGEVYFWSFIVALMVFLVGGALSIVAGVRHIIHPQPVESPWLSYGVLVAAAVFDGLSFVVGYREYKRVIRGRRISLVSFIRISKDPTLFATLLEDGAGVAGVAIAAAGVFGATALGWKWADGTASILIGLLLVSVAAVMANETRSLIAGEAAAPPIVEAICQVMEDDARIARIEEVATLHLGPDAILIAATLTFQPGLGVVKLGEAIQELTAALKRTDGRIAYVFVRPSQAG